LLLGIVLATHLRGLFVNYWDTACYSHSPWQKVVQIWCYHISTSVNCTYQEICKIIKWL